MKKVIIKQVFPLLLIMLLLFELMPINTITAGEESNEPHLGAIVDTDQETYENLNTAKAALKGIATLSGYPGASAVTDGVFGAIFGTEYKQIQDVLSKINQKLNAIQAQISNLTEFIARKIDLASLKSTLEKRIYSYSDVVPAYKERYDLYSSRLAKLEKKVGETPQEETERLQATRDFYLFTVNNDQVSSNFHSAVYTLGNIIINEDQLAGLNLFAAFDKLVLYSFNWEHQGYPYRIAFQSHIISLYTSLATISLAGLTVGIDEAEEQLKTMPEGTDKRILKDSKATMETRRDNLLTQVKALSALSDEYVVNIRPSNERYYQVPGHEMLLKANAVPKTVNPTYPERTSGWIMSYDLFGGVICNDIPKSYFFGKDNDAGYMPAPYDGISAPYPSTDWFMSVYKDYGGIKSLHDIFFSESEGAFEKPGIIGLNSDPNPAYVTSDWWKTTIPMMGMDFYYMNLIDKSGKVLEDRLLATVNLQGSGQDGVKNWNPNMLIGLVVIEEAQMLLSSSVDLKIIGMDESYKAPYKNINLSVEDKGEFYTYEWQVDTDGYGFITIDGANSSSYTLSAVDNSMNGYQYRCQIVDHNLGGDVKTIYTDSVTLIMEIQNNTLLLVLSLVAFVTIAGVITIIVVKKKKQSKASKV